MILFLTICFPSHWFRTEAGCGVGAQTQLIATKNLIQSFISVDISDDSVKTARESIKSLGINNVDSGRPTIYKLPFKPNLRQCDDLLCFGAFTNPVQAT
jgi:tRNA G46 methylase TrmB